MYKNLLVHIPTERSPRPAIDGSDSLAMNWGAHLDAIATGWESSSLPFVAEGGAAVASIIEVEHGDASVDRDHGNATSTPGSPPSHLPARATRTRSTSLAASRPIFIFTCGMPCSTHPASWFVSCSSE